MRQVKLLLHRDRHVKLEVSLHIILLVFVANLIIKVDPLAFCKHRINVFFLLLLFLFPAHVQQMLLQFRWHFGVQDNRLTNLFQVCILLQSALMVLSMFSPAVPPPERQRIHCVAMLARVLLQDTVNDLVLLGRTMNQFEHLEQRVDI